MKTVLEAIAYMERRTVSGLLSRLIEQHLRTYKRETIWEALREMKRRKDEERATNEDLPLWSLMEEVRQKEASDKASDTKAKKKK
jgi:hypothetical protein